MGTPPFRREAGRALWSAGGSEIQAPHPEQHDDLAIRSAGLTSRATAGIDTQHLSDGSSCPIKSLLSAEESAGIPRAAPSSIRLTRAHRGWQLSRSLRWTSPSARNTTQDVRADHGDGRNLAPARKSARGRESGGRGGQPDNVIGVHRRAGVSLQGAPLPERRLEDGCSSAFGQTSAPRFIPRRASPGWCPNQPAASC